MVKNTLMKQLFAGLLMMVAGIATTYAQEVVFDENAEIRTTGDFTGIDLSGSLSLYLSQGDENAIAISAGEEKYNSKIKTEVKNGILKISVDGGFWNGMGWTNKKLKAYVSIKKLQSLDVSGASLVSISGILSADDLKIDISGASEIKGALNVNNLNIDISGASVARLTGKVNNALVDASGACKLGTTDLEIGQCKADASGASAIRLTVTKEFNASASGGAHIYYKGNPSVIKANSSAGATIKQLSSTRE